MDISEKIKTARDARDEELWDALRLHNPHVMSNALLNRNLTEDMALFIAKSKSTPQEALGALAGDVRFKGSYKIKLAICKNPRTPQKVALPLLKFIRIFDLADLTRDQRIPVILRQKVELMLTERIPSLPLGVKSALSRRACSSVVVKIMEKGDRKVIDACLESQLITEEQLYRLILRENLKPIIVRAIAENPKWSTRYSLQFGLVRNFNTPMGRVETFLGNLKSLDLKTLYADPKVPLATKPFIFRELRERGEDLELPKDVVYEIPEEPPGVEDGDEDVMDERYWIDDEDECPGEDDEEESDRAEADQTDEDKEDEEDEDEDDEGPGLNASP